MSAIDTVDLASAIIAGYEMGQEIGREVGSLEALSSLDDVLEFVPGSDYGDVGSGSVNCNDPYGVAGYDPSQETTETDPDKLFLDNLGDRVLGIERVLSENGLRGVSRCGPDCPCKGF